MYLVFQWLVTALTILMLPQIFSGVAVTDMGAAILAAAVLGLLNLSVKPVLFVLTLPITVVSLGLFYLVLNAIVFQFMGALVPGVTISGFWSALGSSLVVSFVSWIFNVSFRRQQTGRAGFIVKEGPRRVRELN